MRKYCAAILIICLAFSASCMRKNTDDSEDSKEILDSVGITETEKSDKDTDEPDNKDDADSHKVVLKTDLDSFVPYEVSVSDFKSDNRYTISDNVYRADYVANSNNKFVYPYLGFRGADIYGLANEKGEIVCYPKFASVKVFENCYILNTGVELDMDEPDDPDIYYYPYEYRYGILSFDGSKYSGCIYEDYLLKDDGYVYFYDDYDDHVDVFRYDGDCNLVNTMNYKISVDKRDNDWWGYEIVNVYDNGNIWIYDHSSYSYRLFNGNTGEMITEVILEYYGYCYADGDYISYYDYDNDIKISYDQNGDKVVFGPEEETDVEESNIPYNDYDIIFDDLILVYDDFVYNIYDKDLNLIFEDVDPYCGGITVISDGSDSLYVLVYLNARSRIGYISVPVSEFPISDKELWETEDLFYGGTVENLGYKMIKKSELYTDMFDFTDALPLPDYYYDEYVSDEQWMIDYLNKNLDHYPDEALNIGWIQVACSYNEYNVVVGYEKSIMFNSDDVIIFRYNSINLDWYETD
ncbi:MAG: hypothetical protein K6F83_03170 [Clostridiales bacterium]|nr:hypothetical protein [Clostridiales bacterium]